MKTMWEEDPAELLGLEEEGPMDLSGSEDEEEEEPTESMSAGGEDEGEEEEAPSRPRPKKALADQDGAWGKAVALWQEVQPELRDLVFLAFGALAMLVVIFLIHFITGLGLPYIAGLATGVVASYFVERFVRWRQQQRASAT